MRLKQSHQLLYTLLFCFLLVSCQSQTKPIHIPMFKGMKMYITKQQFNSFVDSLVTNDPAFSIVSDDDQHYCQFREVTEGHPYYGYLLPTFTNGILTRLTIYYLPFSVPAFATQYSYGKEPYLITWGEGVNRFQNDINLKLQIKYGLPVKSGKTVSPYPLVNYTYLFHEWEKDDLSVKFAQEVEKDDGLNNFTSCNFLVEYSPTEEFQQQNKKLIDDILRNNNSMY